jgi:hypothetical protein
MRFNFLGLFFMATLGLAPTLGWSQSHSLRFKESGCYQASGKILKSSSKSFNLQVLTGTRSQSTFQVKAPNLQKQPGVNDLHEMALYIEVSNDKAVLSTPAAVLKRTPAGSKLAVEGIQWARHGKDLASCL